MNREIKFRAQRTDTKEFVYGYYRENTFFDLFGNMPEEVYTKHFIGSFDNINLFDGIFEQVEVIPETVGQFTGKLDDNRKEIFEGDIVVDIIGKHYSVEWNDDTCKYQLSDGSDLNDNDRYGTYLVVIGNIYENKKLIN